MAEQMTNKFQIPNSHHVSFATPRNDENGFITISCCSICT
ncbi:hypothetical protein KsCSTR_30460 [Candidatus Kuenenia stuttgartiensis]|uniref:Uncharacterized protein n=1 Tax=Kuenenia stuttgartiensis TaxID=174633 RepID=Q1Q5G2_KUEST|nr:hypothetical protein KsCSTR_30460 [Candidatus Kuenenia stuttgartiensis]CAJ75257.1 unknown protein [Candidatus Kuenenia stuttgartiensis]